MSHIPLNVVVGGFHVTAVRHKHCITVNQRRSFSFSVKLTSSKTLRTDILSFLAHSNKYAFFDARNIL